MSAHHRIISVLVVEDDPMFSAWVSHALSANGVDVCGTAATIAEAMSLARSAEPDLCLVDIGLAGQESGFDAACELIGLLGMPVVLMSGHRHEESVLPFLKKPFTADQLLDVVRRTLVLTPSH
jgi:DNA-binding response OmpR family regulator